MPDWGCGAHNRGHLNQKCHCEGRSKHKKKHFFSSDPRYHYPDKPVKFSRKKPQKKSYRTPKPPPRRKYIKKRRKPADKKSCFLCGAKGHWASKCPKKKHKPRLAAFCASVQPQWWRYSSSSKPPTGEFVYLPDDSDSEFHSASDSEDLPELNKFGPSSASSSDLSDSASDTDASEVPNLGGCNLPSSPHSSISSSVHTFQPPEFNFSLYMLSFPQQHYDLEKQIAAIDLAFAETQPYQYQRREQLRTEKELLLEQLKGKKKLLDNPSNPPVSKVVSFHEPATVYKAYPDKHESRQQYRLSNRETLRAMIKEKQQQIKQLCTEVSEL